MYLGAMGRWLQFGSHRSNWSHDRYSGENCDEIDSQCGFSPVYFEGMDQHGFSLHIVCHLAICAGFSSRYRRLTIDRYRLSPRSHRRRVPSEVLLVDRTVGKVSAYHLDHHPIAQAHRISVVILRNDYSQQCAAKVAEVDGL